MAENLKGIKENLEKQYPEASAKAKEFQESFNKELNKLYEQGKILAENVKGDLSGVFFIIAKALSHVYRLLSVSQKRLWLKNITVVIKNDFLRNNSCW